LARFFDKTKICHSLTFKNFGMLFINLMPIINIEKRRKNDRVLFDYWDLDVSKLAGFLQIKIEVRILFPSALAQRLVRQGSSGKNAA